jgi:hypothetical protein
MPGWLAIFAIICRGLGAKLYSSFMARTTRPAGLPNQANGSRRSYRIVTAPGSALPNQAGDESGKSFASTGQISRGEAARSPFFNGAAGYGMANATDNACPCNS